MTSFIVRGHFQLKRLAPLSLLGIIAVAGLGGCGGGGGGGGSSSEPAVTENDLAADPSIAPDPEGGVVVDLLESAGSAPPEQDTADVGVDVIPYFSHRTLTNTFCWDDDDLEAQHVMILIGSNGAEVLRLQPNGACATATIEPGEYSLRLVHDDRSADAVAVFIQPVDAAGSARLESGPVQTVRRLFADTLGRIGLAQPALAQSQVSRNLETLLRTNKCPGCALEFANLAKASLANADLSAATLSGADLSQAILTRANLDKARMVRSLLTGAELSEASIFNADLSDANLHQARLSGARGAYADLHGADLSAAKLGAAQLPFSHLEMANLAGAELVNAEFEGANLTRANLVGADMDSAGLNRTQLVDADFTNADLSYAQLCQANIAGAKFTGATLTWTVWTNCRQCAPESVGQCMQGPAPTPCAFCL